MGSALLLGGARSGKSALAVEIGERAAAAGQPVVFVATATGVDDDMASRIERHRAERPAWPTIEEPHDLGGALVTAPADALVIVDCLTLWVSNLMWRGDGDAEIEALAHSAAQAAAARDSVTVSNEVGLGVHPGNDLGRRYRDLLGRVNRTWAAAVDRTLFLVAGRAVALDDPGSCSHRPPTRAPERARDRSPRPAGPGASSPTCTHHRGDPVTDLSTAEPTTWLRGALGDLPGGDTASAAAVADRAANILRPFGALARLDDVAVWVATWQRTPTPAIAQPAALIFAADHGVAAANVSAYPPDVTSAMLGAYRSGRSTISAFAAIAGATVQAIDVGVGRPTGDIRTEPAMSPERFAEAIAAGRDAVVGLEADLLVLGEMGIGNTTAAAAVAAALGGGEVAAWVGRGTGIDDATLERKQLAVRTAVDRVAGITDPLEVLRELGGAELVAMAAAIVAARQRALPVLIDGYVVTAAAFTLFAAAESALDHCQIGHVSAEPGHRRLLERMHKRPLLELEMRLGEGSGAMAAVPLVAMACAGVTRVPTFGEWFGE